MCSKRTNTDLPLNFTNSIFLGCDLNVLDDYVLKKNQGLSVFDGKWKPLHATSN